MPLGTGNTSASSVKTSTKTTSNQMFQQTGCCPRFHVVSSAGSPKFEVSPLCPKKSITRLVAGVSQRYSCIRLVLLFLKKGRAVKSKEMPLGTGNTSASAVKTSTKTTSNQMFQQTGCCPRFHVVSSAGSPKFEVSPLCPKKSITRLVAGVSRRYSCICLVLRFLEKRSCCQERRNTGNAGNIVFRGQNIDQFKSVQTQFIYIISIIFKLNFFLSVVISTEKKRQHGSVHCAPHWAQARPEKLLLTGPDTLDLPMENVPSGNLT